MKYIKKYENIPHFEENEKTITIRSTDNPNFYVNIYFDDNDKVIYVYPPTYIKAPDWLNKKITLKDIENFCDNFNSRNFNKKIMTCDYLYNIKTKKFNL